MTTVPMFGYKPVKKDEPEPEVEPDTSGLDKVDLWRMEQFEALGFSALSAFMLAMLGADYREAGRLLARNPSHGWVYDQLT